MQMQRIAPIRYRITPRLKLLRASADADGIIFACYVSLLIKIMQMQFLSVQYSTYKDVLKLSNRIY